MGWLIICAVIICSIINMMKAYQQFHDRCSKIIDDHDLRVAKASGLVDKNAKSSKPPKTDKEQQWVGEWLHMKPHKRKGKLKPGQVPNFQNIAQVKSFN